MPRAGVGKGADAVHHVVSRICGRQFLLSDVEKEAFRGLLRRVAGFCGVEIITFALLDNHFHLLVEVPGTPGDLSDEVLLERARLLYGKERKGQPLSVIGIETALRMGGEVRLAMRNLLMGRMASLPMFMKILKQRFSILFNRKYDRLGTLWEGRFRSVLVENTRVAVQAVAAYIDLNPVRAGVADDPKDYRFSGYGEAAGSGRLKDYALWRRLVGRRDESMDAVAARYRRYLYVSASDPRKGRTLSPDEVASVLEQEGTLSMAQMLRCRLLYMTQGAIIGSKAFVEEWVHKQRSNVATGRGKAQKPPTKLEAWEEDHLFTVSARR